MSELIGYARVSTGDQDAAAQVAELKAAGCSRVYVEKASGTRDARPELLRALDHLRAGDTLVASRLDRLGRSLKQLVLLVEDLAERGVNLRTLHGISIDTTTPDGSLIFHIFASLSEFEAALTRERTNIGLAAARARGRRGGRPSRMTPERLKMAQQMYDSRDPQYTLETIARTIGVGRTTVVRHLRRTPAPT